MKLLSLFFFTFSVAANAQTSVIEPLLADLDQDKSKVRVICENHFAKITLDFSKLTYIDFGVRQKSYLLDYTLQDKFNGETHAGSGSANRLRSVPNNSAGDRFEEISFIADSENQYFKDVTFTRETSYIGTRFELSVLGVTERTNFGRGAGSGSDRIRVKGVTVENCKHVELGE